MNVYSLRCEIDNCLRVDDTYVLAETMEKAIEIYRDYIKNQYLTNGFYNGCNFKVKQCILLQDHIVKGD